MSRRDDELRVRVNPIACTAHGLCAELLPERVRLDDWGYPVVDERPLEPELVAHAKRAAAACPTLALLLERRAQTTRRSAVATRARAASLSGVATAYASGVDETTAAPTAAAEPRATTRSTM